MANKIAVLKARLLKEQSKLESLKKEISPDMSKVENLYKSLDYFNARIAYREQRLSILWRQAEKHESYRQSIKANGHIAGYDKASSFVLQNEHNRPYFIELSKINKLYWHKEKIEAKIAILNKVKREYDNRLKKQQSVIDEIDKQIKNYHYHIKRQIEELKKHGIDKPKIYRKKKLVKDNNVFLLKIDGSFYVDILLRLAFLAMDYSLQRMDAYKQGYLKKEPCKIETIKHGYFYALWLLKKLKKQGMTFRQAIEAIDFRFNVDASRNNLSRLKMKPVFLDSLYGHYDFTNKIIGRIEREQLYNGLSDNLKHKIKESLHAMGQVPYMDYYKAHGKEKRLLENVAYKLNKENGTTFSYDDIISLHSGLSDENVSQSFHYGIQTSRQTVNIYSE